MEDRNVIDIMVQSPLSPDPKTLLSHQFLDVSCAKKVVQAFRKKNFL